MINPNELVPLMVLTWKKGDKEGQSEIIDNIEKMGEFTWINFKGGGRINGHVVDEMMFLSGMASEEEATKLADAKKTKQDKELEESLYPKIPQNSEKRKGEVIVTSTPKNTFGFDILDKANRDSKMELKILIDFDFISEDKIKMLLEMYGKDLFDSLKDYIRDQISEEVIRGCIEQYLNHKFPDFSKQVNKEEVLPNLEV